MPSQTRRDYRIDNKALAAFFNDSNENQISDMEEWYEKEHASTAAILPFFMFVRLVGEMATFKKLRVSR